MIPRLLDAFRAVLQIATLVVWVRVFAWCAEPLVRAEHPRVGRMSSPAVRSPASPPRCPP